MTSLRLGAVLTCILSLSFVLPLRAQEEEPDDKEAKTPAAISVKDWKAVTTAAEEGKGKGDSAWILVSSALVMLMVPGLALFYGGMVRRKNILGTMMQSMVALAIVGVFWIAFGYSLAFGKSWHGIIGWHPDLVFMIGIVDTGQLLPNTNIPIYLHMLFQGMFAIITPALISGAFAERIRFGPYLAFILAWVILIYCPLAHMVWAMNWWDAADAGTKAVGLLGRAVDAGGIGALDFAGGTVVHIAAGFSALGGIFVLRKRLGYPQTAIHPSSMVLCLTGAGLLWFGWFGFNGGSALASASGGSGLAGSAFAATQAAAAAAGLSWLFAEWLHKGKPTALGLASGIVAGLVAVTPASGYIYVWGGLAIGLVAGIVCYAAVCLKPLFKYDDSLDVFGVHGVGGFLGAVLTGVFCFQKVNSAGADGLLAGGDQLLKQVIAAVVSAIFAFVGGMILTKIVDLFGFTTDDQSEIAGLDRIEHGESGFDFGLASESTSTAYETEPRPALIPPTAQGRFQVVVEGVSNGDLMHAWNDLCQPGSGAPSEFKAVYPYVTTVMGNRFQFRGGPKEQMRDNLQRLFQGRLNAPIKVKLEG